MELSKKQSASLQEVGIDSKTGISTEERMLQAMLEAQARDGHLAPHDMELLQRQADERAILNA